MITVILSKSITYILMFFRRMRQIHQVQTCSSPHATCFVVWDRSAD